MSNDVHYFEPVTVILSCGHRTQFKPDHVPAYGEAIYCMRCDGPAHLPFPLGKDVDDKPVLREWEWMCMSARGRCTPRHGLCGKSMQLAIEGAKRHVKLHPTHPMWIVSPRGLVVARWEPVVERLF